MLMYIYTNSSRGLGLKYKPIKYMYLESVKIFFIGPETFHSRPQ